MESDLNFSKNGVFKNRVVKETKFFEKNLVSKNSLEIINPLLYTIPVVIKY